MEVRKERGKQQKKQKRSTRGGGEKPGECGILEATIHGSVSRREEIISWVLHGEEVRSFEDLELSLNLVKSIFNKNCL